MTIYQKTGVGIILLAIGMFFFGVYMFSYQGEIDPIISKIGMYSFLFWLPALITGILLTVRGRRDENK